MMDSKETNQLLELYRLHAELADRVSRRREGANQLYAGLLTGLTATIGALLNFGSNGPEVAILLVGGVLIAALAASWFIVIRSYRQLNTGKFAALLELEANLAYPFFTREWELLEEGKSFRKYWKLTVVETWLPVIFFALAIGLVLISYIVVA